MTLHKYLKTYFGYDHFQEGQEEIIRDVLRGEDILGILKTGSGKSLCYQLPALMLDGLTIVVSPLISLMLDQVREMKALHVKRVAALHSLQSKEERQMILNNLRKFKILFVSPEILQQRSLIHYLIRCEISLFVVDEAHCISQWGYELRPDYLRLKTVINQLGDPPILALTGTATPQVQQDIMLHLNRQNMKKHIYQMDRYNISLLVEQLHDEEAKRRRLIELLQIVNRPTIIYFSSRKLAEQFATFIRNHVPNRQVAYYHGGMDPIDRLKIQQQFMHDQIDIICSTSAFGMGINKRNIRFVIHYHLPTQIDSYIQEIGRAGRDGKESVSVLLYREGDEQLPYSIIENEVPNEEELHVVFRQLYRLYKEEKRLPEKEVDIEAYFQIDETKWRLISFHLEQNGIIFQDKIRYSKEDWEQTFQQLIHFRNERLKIKRAEIDEMKTWVKSTSCLRNGLYERFKQPIEQKKKQCCSNCGFSFQTWLNSDDVKQKRQITNSWQEKLAFILQMGDKHETSGNY